jgi:hypothetical protein
MPKEILGLANEFLHDYSPPLDSVNPKFPEGMGVGSETVSSGPRFTDSFLFAFNTPFSVSLSLNAISELHATNLDAGELLWYGGASLQRTAHIRGVAIFDEAGNPISDATITSASGLDWAIVPEPSALALLAGGLASLAGLARTSRARPSGHHGRLAWSRAASSAREWTPSFSKIDRT